MKTLAVVAAVMALQLGGTGIGQASGPAAIMHLAQAMPGMGGLGGKQGAPPAQQQPADPAPFGFGVQQPARPSQTPPSQAPAPAGQPVGQEEYFVDRPGKPAGPFSRERVIEAIRTGAIGPSASLWKAGMADWQRADQFPEFRPHFAAARPALPQRQQPPQERAGQPPSGTASTNALRDFMVGTWQITVARQVGTQARTTIQYRQDGSLSGRMEQTGRGGTQRAEFRGKWSVKPRNQNEITLTVQVAGQKKSSSVVLRYVDDNTLFNVTDRANAYRIAR